MFAKAREVCGTMAWETMRRGDDRAATRLAARGVTPACVLVGSACLLAPTWACVRLNPDFEDTGTQGGGGEGGGTSSPLPSSTSAAGGTGAGTERPPTTGAPATTQGSEPPDAWDFTDDEREEFEAGELSMTEWSDGPGAVVLMRGTSKGQLLSRVFQTDGVEAALTRLEWTALAPYGVGLWDPGVDELEEYAMGGIDKAGLELLLRFDRDQAPFEPMATVLDASSMGNDGIVHGPALMSVPGLFGWAVENTGDSYVRHSTSSLAPGTSEFTWSAWFRGDACDPSTSIVNFDALDAQDAGTVSLWLACGQSVDCPNAIPPGHAVIHGALFEIDESGNGDGVHRCGTARIDDQNWHHLAMVVRRSQGMTHLDLFADGEQEASASLESQSDYAYNNLQHFSTIGNADEHHPAQGFFDEVTVWRRPLSLDEIKTLYARGARRVTVRVRACDEDDCSDEPPFIGPGGEDSFFLDSGPEHDHGHDLSDLDLVGVAFQYELTLEASLMVASPQFPRISLHAER